jgi:hypothetical protein
VALDGEELSYVQDDRNTRVHIEMLPGKHEVDIGNVDDPLRRIVTLDFVAEAGKVYRVTLDELEAGSLMRPWNALMWEVDRDSDRALHTVPSPAAAPSVPAVVPSSAVPATPSAAASATVTAAPSPPPSAEAAPSASSSDAPAMPAPSMSASPKPAPSGAAPAASSPATTPASSP